MLKFFLPFLIFFFLLAGFSSAEFYKWEDENGNIIITDYPPPTTSVKKMKVHKSEPQSANISTAEADQQKNSPAAPSGNTTAETKRNNEVILYTTSWCPYCKMARDFFKSRNVNLTEYDIEKDSAAAERKNRLDRKGGVPFAIINGQQIHGYSPNSYERALQ